MSEQDNAGKGAPTLSVIEALEGMIKAAERGEITAVVVLAATSKGATATTWAGESVRRDAPVLLVALRLMEKRVLEWWTGADASNDG